MRNASRLSSLSRETYEVSATARRQVTEDLNVLLDLFILGLTLLQSTVEEEASIQDELK